MPYLLGANIISDLVRNPRGKIAEHIAVVGAAEVCTSIIVAAELRYGAAKKGSPRLTERIDAILRAIKQIPFAQPADDIYADIRANLERAGIVIGSNDLFIAAHALAAKCTLVTDNGREFARVPGLAVENWLR